MFHNSDGATLEDVRAAIEAHGFQFPVAVDRKTRTRLRWCGGRDDYGFTSVSFLLDRQGVIRYIHPGGQYVKGDGTYELVEFEIERLLAEPPGDFAAEADIRAR